MRSLLKAFLLAPAIVSALVLPSSSKQDVDAEFKENDTNSTDAYTIGFVRLDIGHAFSSADMSPLDLRIDILHSTEACGFGNVTIDGQALSQIFNPETLVSSGKGSVSTSTNKLIVGSWSFDCIIIDGKPHEQSMKFMVDFVEGKAFQNVGFSVLFRQTEKTEILNIETISSEEGEFIKYLSRQGQSFDKKHHNGKGSGEHGHHIGHKDFNIHKELAELRYMKAQLEELKYLIHQKKRHISKHFQENHNLDRIRDCDSLRCVARVISGRARRFYENIAGYGGDEQHFHHSSESQSERGRKRGKEFHGKLGNHNHTSGNHEFPGKPHGKNNHTDPHFPHHNRQHILPVCHYPPPFDFHPHSRHHDRPHGPPHGPPPHEFGHHRFEHERHSGVHHFQDDEEGGRHWEGRPRHPGGHYGRPNEDNYDEVEMPHRNHDGFSHRQDDFDSESEGRHRNHAKPDHGQGLASFDAPDLDQFKEHHHGPPHAGPFHGPEHERPPHPHERPLKGPEHERPHDPHDGFHHGLPQDGPHHEGPVSQETEIDRPQHESPEDQSAFHEPPPHDEPHPGPGPHFNGPPPPIMEENNHIPPGAGRPPKPPHSPLHILKFILIGFLLFLLIITLHRRTCNSTSHMHSDRHEKQHQRRTYKRASRSQQASFKSWWLRITRGEEFEEKDRDRDALLGDYDSDVESTSTPTIDISDNTPNLHNTTQAAQEMVAVEDPHTHLLSPISPPNSPIPSHAQVPGYMNPLLNFNGYTNQNQIQIQTQNQIQDEDILPPYSDEDSNQNQSHNHHYDHSYNHHYNYNFNNSRK
ncbi:hypothetical protein SS1G_13240 [Sclerotinia sclerotiorum 1980 UF-70]|uniref:Uncharacterized protein n=1 Tax=Sclerotinia sclerotiorum (strain ATCC 18683 / 1980 / Ss-1) TaxID=665079 RepID=A7F6L1_SCLS1|nr:hypothetical protein SS1G_13240 [Sclerotinia sclerotiorum 1980 UF-70]EDN98382.1 hypothetical protein SS1G_13240 [Sclerotinia sclerotiorum 1980 UF-70]